MAVGPAIPSPHGSEAKSNGMAADFGGGASRPARYATASAYGDSASMHAAVIGLVGERARVARGTWGSMSHRVAGDAEGPSDVSYPAPVGGP